MDTAKGRYYFNADRTALVHEGDPEAAFFAVGPGDDMPEGFKAPKGSPPDDDAEAAAQAVLDQRAEEERVATEGHVPAKASRSAIKDAGDKQ